jgi:hypothetical protein
LKQYYLRDKRIKKRKKGQRRKIMLPGIIAVMHATKYNGNTSDIKSNCACKRTPARGRLLTFIFSAVSKDIF